MRGTGVETIGWTWTAPQGSKCLPDGSLFSLFSTKTSILEKPCGEVPYNYFWTQIRDRRLTYQFFQCVARTIFPCNNCIYGKYRVQWLTAAARYNE